MDPKLLALIQAYEETTARALAHFLQRANMEHPWAWRQMGMPRGGTLMGEPPIRYAFHGIGLHLEIGAEQIDFDFGFDGRTGGFNHWWLQKFAEEHSDRFGEFLEGDRLE